MKNRLHKKLILLAVTFCICLGTTTMAATLSSVTDSGQQEEAEEKAEEAEKKEKEIRQKLEDLHSDIYDMSVRIMDKQEKINRTQEKMDDYSSQMEQMQENVDKQKEGIRQRMRVIYEKMSTRGALLSLLDGETFVQYMNRQEYIRLFLEYDREKLNEYQESLESLQKEGEKLAKVSEQLEKERQELDSEYAKLLADIAKKQEQLDEAKQEKIRANKELQELMALMVAYELELQMQDNGGGQIQDSYPGTQLPVTDDSAFSSEDAAQVKYYYDNNQPYCLEEQLAMQYEAEGYSGGTVTPREGEENLLAHIIYCESGTESYESKVAVGSVVLNRVNSPHFPNTITEVIYSPMQFQPVRSGRLAIALENNLATEDCRRAAHEVLNEGVSGEWLFFRVHDGTRHGLIIDNQIFY